MATPPAPPPGSAEDVFAAFLERLEGGERVDFDALCAAHPDLAGRLRRIHLRWLAMTRAFAELGSAGDAASRAEPPPRALGALMARLEAKGARIDRYALGAEIARGAMGRVVQAWDEELHREVALKIQRGDPGDDRQQRRFLEEAQIAAQLDHPGIVPIHELGLDADGRPFFTMKLVRGADLGEILALLAEGKGEWTRTRVLHVLLRVCEAMAFAHARGVVHRDLKPANVMVGRFGEAYVMDWGLAHVRSRGVDGPAVDSLRARIAGDGDSPLLTQHGDVVGTPSYMAPEQAWGQPGADAPAVDVYALGALLYHVLAGRMPHDHGDSPDAATVLHRVRTGPPRPLPHDVPPELRAICERAMARAVADRYATVEALGNDLRAFLELRTVAAYASGRFAELRKWIARNRALAASLAALLVSALGGTIAVTTSWLQAERARRVADERSTALRAEVDRNSFRSARQSLQLGNSVEATDALWRAHLDGRMPRATAWALLELAERDPYLVTLPVHRNNRSVTFHDPLDAVLLAAADGVLEVRDAGSLALRARVGDPGPALTAVAAPARGTLAFAGTAGGELLVFDLATGRCTRRVAAHAGPVGHVVVVGATALATGGSDGRVL